MAHAFVLIMAVMVFVNVLVYVCMHPILWFLRVPQEVMEGMRQYLVIIYAGLLASSLYNFFACLLRALGNSTVPLVFLAVSSVLNIGLDLLFVVGFHWGIRGAAAATVVSQYIAGNHGCCMLLCHNQGVRLAKRWNRRNHSRKGCCVRDLIRLS